MIGKATSEKRCRLHIHSHCSSGSQVLLESFIELPDATVGRIDRTCPIVKAKVANGTTNSALQHEGRQGGHFRREIVVTCTLPPNTGDGQDKVAALCFCGNTTAFAQEKTSFRLNSTKQVHNNGSIRASHSEINHSDAISRCTTHVRGIIRLFNAEALAENIYIVIEVRQQNIRSEAFKRHLRISWQPILYDFLLCFHLLCNFAANIRKKMICRH